jgi:prepilin-type N-terminal cleavage/methylation domain-containing protein
MPGNTGVTALMKGFTLLEILVSILIFCFIMGGMYGVVSISKTTYDVHSVSLDLQRQARQGMAWLVRDIRGATSSINGSSNNITFDTSDETHVNYYVNATTSQLERTSLSSTLVIGAIDITGLSVTNSSSFYKIELNASKTFNSGGRNRTVTFPLSEKVQARNS